MSWVLVPVEPSTCVHSVAMALVRMTVWDWRGSSVVRVPIQHPSMPEALVEVTLYFCLPRTEPCKMGFSLPQVSPAPIHRAGKNGRRKGTCCHPSSHSQVLPALQPLSSFLSTGRGSSLKAVPDGCLQFLSLKDSLLVLSPNT